MDTNPTLGVFFMTKYDEDFKRSVVQDYLGDGGGCKAQAASIFEMHDYTPCCAQSLWIQLSIDQLIKVGKVVAYIVRFAVGSDSTIRKLKARA